MKVERPCRLRKKRSDNKRNGHVKLFDTHSDLPTCKIGTLQIWTCEFSPQRLPQRLPSCLPQRFPPCFLWHFSWDRSTTKFITKFATICDLPSHVQQGTRQHFHGFVFGGECGGRDAMKMLPTWAEDNLCVESVVFAGIGLQGVCFFKLRPTNWNEREIHQ